MTEFTDFTDTAPARPRPPKRRRAVLALAAGGLLALGGTIGAVVVAETRPSVTMAPATPVAIRSLATTGGSNAIVTIRGRVAEIYGNKFVMADASGRALVDAGREGEDGDLVAAGQTVTVQGRFDHGFVHAAFLVGADGKVRALGPVGGPPHDGPGRHDRDHGPDRGPGGRPDRDDADAPPPPAAAPAAAPTAAASTAK